MSKESVNDLDGSENRFSKISRRAIVVGGLGLIALACTPPSPESAPEVKTADKAGVDKDQPVIVPTKEPNPLDPIEIQASRVKFVYPDQLSESDWADVARGVNIPLPFSRDSFPLQAATLVRRIKAKDPIYQEWVGREIVDSILGFMLNENSELVAFAKGTMVLQPERTTDIHSANTTRIEFRPEANKSLLYVYRIGGRNNIEWLTNIPSSPTRSIPVEPGQVLGRITQPGKVPSIGYPDILSNPPGTYHMWLTQQSVRPGENGLNSIFREENGIVTSSQLSLASLKRSTDESFICLNSVAGK